MSENIIKKTSKYLNNIKSKINNNSLTKDDTALLELLYQNIKNLRDTAKLSRNFSK